MGRNKKKEPVEEEKNLDDILCDLNALFYALSTLTGNAKQDVYPPQDVQHTVDGLNNWLKSKNISFLNNSSAQRSFSFKNMRRKIDSLFEKCNQPSAQENKFRCYVADPLTLLAYEMDKYAFVGTKDSDNLHNLGLIIGLKIDLSPEKISINNAKLKRKLCQLKSKTISYRLDYDEEYRLHFNFDLFGMNIHIPVENYRNSTRFRINIDDNKTCAEATKYKFWFKMSFSLRPDQKIGEILQNDFKYDETKKDDLMDQATAAYMNKNYESSWSEVRDSLKEISSFHLMRNSNYRKVFLPVNVGNVPTNKKGSSPSFFKNFWKAQNKKDIEPSTETPSPEAVTPLDSLDTTRKSNDVPDDKDYPIIESDESGKSSGHISDNEEKNSFKEIKPP